MLEATATRGPSALRFHNARLFLAGQGLSNIGTFSQIVALSLLVLQLTDSGLALGAVMAAQALPFMLLGPWAGSVLDRVPLRRVLFVTALAGAAQAACLAGLALTGTINLAWVFGLAIGLGCVQVLDRPGGQAFLAELVPREAIAGAVGLASSAQAIGRLGGPALAAVLYAWAGAGKRLSRRWSTCVASWARRPGWRACTPRFRSTGCSRTPIRTRTPNRSRVESLPQGASTRPNPKLFSEENQTIRAPRGPGPCPGP